MCKLTNQVVENVQNAIIAIEQWDAGATQLMENMKAHVKRADEEVKKRFSINLTFDNNGAKDGNK